MKVSNTTRGDIGLDMETVIPAGGSAEVEDKKFARLKSVEINAWRFDQGHLVAEGADVADVAEEVDVAEEAAIMAELEAEEAAKTTKGKGRK